MGDERHSVTEGFTFNAHLYGTLYDVVTRRSNMLAKWVPDFLINDSIKHFEKQEQYEKCHMIKSFFDKNPARVFHMSRSDWMDHGWRTVYAH